MGEFHATELALVLNHAVDVGINRFPIASLYLGNKTGKHLTDVFLVFWIDGGREFVGGTIPRYDAILLMRKQTHRLPTIGQQDIACKYLLYAKAIIGHYHLMGSTRQCGKR